MILFGATQVNNGFWQYLDQSSIIISYIYSAVSNKSVTFLILFGDFFLPTYMALLGPTRLLLRKIPIYTVFLCNKYLSKKFPPTRPY